MKAIDFLFYYLILFFKRRKRVEINVDPILRTLTVLSVCSVLWAMLISYIIEFFVFGTIAIKIPFYIFIGVGILTSLILKHIYVTDKRYANIIEKNALNFKMSDTNGQILVIGFVIFSYIIFILTAIILYVLR